MTLNLIETLKTSIYNPKHTKNTKIHFELLNSKNENTYFHFSSSFKSEFFADFHGPPLAGPKI